MTMQDIPNSIAAAEEMEIRLRVVKLRLPASCGGAVCREPGGGYMIALNADRTAAEQEASFVHEILHIWRGDLDSAEPVQEIEARTHRRTVEIMQK